MAGLNSTYRHTAGYISLAVVGLVATMAMNSCSGGCSRTEQTKSSTDVVDAPGDIDDPAAILSRPVDFDERTLAEYADKVAGDTLLTDTETARLIVVTEAAVNHLGQIVDGLEQNDDPADTWNVLEELCTSRWPGDIARTTAYLRHAPIDGVERDRALDIDKAIDGIIKTVRRVSRNLNDVADLESILKEPES